ncbi:Asp-tRNA(Asn)/Glu-tRNA(Gln) amidotransferase subunit GatB [Aneurinibacillus aneurinilyticus]|jgi:aspartyl-tRNA(Asn)/glutamyl-tRNA(Gln) amidotransferase subunit B|uniref:Aspartyl/glutamyl-tRNA(Asn/Gln) amidotransferase subunit B n=2 Tax=Aneurinibacillus aneurinilyticus TaxID=1391 RepID=A0A848CWJ2_ANEAE|nr:Asp-tRNA(Asn)/Glu-tRNA(Gln) amidotransferase subunit GatB [Aneurinibacillus aneurinilyticus]ERI10675.1 aspartyl/glutamyl-tRNA(Asn/Gln) amidotransferase, B subunit [Aneurinibacillus aneurinilyticus ATCC 12856]MCI1694025.1 Asp-tRNA(Asn)/Glu-tRNA(Gln) amidotransferase subunit GatB [Aneurinibacillus aneurinilyticus]MED0668954.1 Asp-tRNA(Asn)/Glu-tRNA(Gln) amidotransferase subunit GatB [Aneurinibacillus aneurinilyticus]MED0708493.1 Asp-tRNA(Asn)/Glu-tRNA(Gln) amidotransferase subunit GatB [Aneuri
MQFETVIGLEVHVELSTKSKIFCGCSTEFGAPPNTHTCPICLGHPGVLPVLNKKAVEFAMKAALALNCEISEESKFDRKNYFYPDLPKAYQISQYDQPIGQNGWIDIEVNGETKRIGITRLHLEEDAGKLVHADSGYASLVDYNRVGTPLVEIVSEPDLRSPEEARAYLEKLKAIIQYCEVSDVKMEEGSLRCDANISLRPVGQEAFGIRAELKNVNSFRNVQRGLEYEEVRQADILRDGGEVVQETRRWDEAKGRTVSMRGKEEAHDYRYFPDPDLIKLNISREWVEEIRSSIPELPDARKARYLSEYGLPEYDASVITMSKELSDFFDATVQTGADAKTVANWLMGELIGYLNANEQEMKDIQMTPESLGQMIALIEKGTISNKIAKKVFKEMMETGKNPEKIVEEQGLVQISDEGAIKQMVEEVVAKNPQAVEDFKAGKEKAIGALVGQVMKASKGKANPGVVNQLLRDVLNSL